MRYKFITFAELSGAFPDKQNCIAECCVMARSVFTISLLFLFSASVSGQFDSDPFSAAFNQPVTLEIRLDRQAVSPGHSFLIALVIDVADGWHIYANPKGPGTGKATVVTGQDHDGFLFKPARYLLGEKKSQEEIGPGDWAVARPSASRSPMNP